MALPQGILTAIWAFFVFFLSTSGSPLTPKTPTCKYLAGDPEWPSTLDWDKLNDTVNGRLIAAVPLAQPCHTPNFNAAKCAKVQANWTWPRLHSEDPTSIQNPYWLNDSCSPYTAISTECTLGNIVDYTINVSCAADVAAGVKFAQSKNIRLVIKNTGHDFSGRSTGKGALGLWTHNLSNISFVDYNSTGYTGKAAHLGAGVLAIDAYVAATDHGYRVVGGSCPTVGLAGGFTQGGGHGPLMGAYGLAADNTLEWEVVTPEGEHLVATPEQNSDLYWALSGGGGGTYAVVISLKVKVHPDGPVGGAQLQFYPTNISQEAYWDAISEFHEGLASLISNEGLHAVYTITNTSFFLNFLTWTNHSAEDVGSVLKPLQDYLDENQIEYDHEYTSNPNFYTHYAHFTPDLPVGYYQISELLGGRIIPLSTVENNNAGLTSAIRNITEDGNWIINGVAANLTHARVGNMPESNAVVPAWRDSIAFFNVVVLWDPEAPVAEGAASENEMTYDVVPQLERITSGSGSYINEGDFNDPQWKWDYFGSNYPQLLSVKNKYDPNDLLYAIASVGHDVWDVASDGRLCRTT